MVYRVVDKTNHFLTVHTRKLWLLSIPVFLMAAYDINKAYTLPVEVVSVQRVNDAEPGEYGSIRVSLDRTESIEMGCDVWVSHQLQDSSQAAPTVLKNYWLRHKALAQREVWTKAARDVDFLIPSNGVPGPAIFTARLEYYCSVVQRVLKAPYTVEIKQAIMILAKGK